MFVQDWHYFFFLPQSIDDLDVNPTKAHTCQPRLWLSPVLKHGIWGKIHIHFPKFRHVVESSDSWGTHKKQGKDSRTSEMFAFQACLITELSWLEQKLWHPHLHRWQLHLQDSLAGSAWSCNLPPLGQVTCPNSCWKSNCHSHTSKTHLGLPSNFKLVPFYSPCTVPSSFLMHWNTAADPYFSICPVYGTAHFCCKTTVNNLSNVSFIKHLRTLRSDFVQGMKSYSINPLFRAMMENNIIRSHSFSLEIVIGLWIL